VVSCCVCVVLCCVVVVVVSSHTTTLPLYYYYYYYYYTVWTSLVGVCKLCAFLSLVCTSSCGNLYFSSPVEWF